MRFLKVTSLLCVGIIATSLSLGQVALAQTPQPASEFISAQTGFTVVEPFYAYFVAGGGEARYGAPITNQYYDQNLGLMVQYFEKVRMEFHPGNPPEFQVLLGLLGEEMNKRQLPIPVSQIPAPNDPNCRYYRETGHTVCHKFLEYYDQNGGLNMFGYPITEFVVEGNRIVQYFQRARMEWHPERPIGQRVQLADLGEIYFTLTGGNPLLRTPSPNSASAGTPITLLRVRANLADQVVPKNTQHSLKVTVHDQLFRPVEGAGVKLEVYYPTGVKTFNLPLTDATGATRFSFNAGSATAGTVVRIRVIVIYGSLTGITRTDYLVWHH